MRLLNWITNRADADVDEKRATSLEVLDRIDGWNAGRMSEAGIIISETTALQVTAVMACVGRISLDVANMPLNLKTEDADGNPVLQNKTRVAEILRRKPNPKHTPTQFKQMMTAQAALHGVGLAYVMRDPSGIPTEVWPLSRTQWSCQTRGWTDEFIINAYDGELSGKYSRRDVFELRPQTMDGTNGIDRLKYAANAIGLAQAAQLTQSRSYKNGNRMTGYWTTEGTLSENALARIGASLRAATSGGNQWKSPLLDSGLMYKSSGQTFTESQMIETRKHELIEVCAMFGMLPAVLGIDDKTQAFASVEAMFMAHLRHTLNPWLTSWEESIDRDLLDGANGPKFAKFDTSGFEKATTKERAESYRTLLETLVMTPNEARRAEGLQPIEGLDEVWLEIVKGKSGQAATGEPDSTPAAEQESDNDDA